jgi:hypothetical protein
VEGTRANRGWGRRRAAFGELHGAGFGIRRNVSGPDTGYMGLE